MAPRKKADDGPEKLFKTSLSWWRATQGRSEEALSIPSGAKEAAEKVGF